MSVTFRDYYTPSNFTTDNYFTMFESALKDLGWLSEVDLGVTRFSILNTVNTNSTTGNFRYIITPTICSLSGAVMPVFVMKRYNSTFQSLSQLNTGSNWRGKGNQAGTFSQAGTTTITITLKAHGLNTNDSVYIDFTGSSGTEPTDSIYRVTKIDNNTISVTSSSSSTGSGTVVVYGFAGSYERTTNRVIVTSPNHSLVDGSTIYANFISGGISALTVNAITVIDADTFSFESLGSNTSGIAIFNHIIKINGSQIGLTDGGTNDVLVKVDRCLGVAGSSTTVIAKGNSNLDYYSSLDHMVFKMINDSTKRLGSQFMIIQKNSISNIYIGHSPVWDPQSGDCGTNNNDGEVHISQSTINIQTNNGNSNLQLRTWQSGIDPSFAVFSFYQNSTIYANLIFHKFKPLDSAPFTLDDLSLGGITVITQNDYLGHKTYTMVGKNCAEHYYNTNESYYANNYDSYTSMSVNYYGTGQYIYDSGSSCRLFTNNIYPSNANFGPFIYRLPLHPHMVPSFYSMPDDFGLMGTNASALNFGDTITVTSGVEVYTVVARGNNSNNASAFLARTT